MSKPQVVTMADGREFDVVAETEGHSLDSDGLTDVEFGQIAHDGMYLTPMCHPGAPVLVMYHSGSLLIECFACHKPVAGVAIRRRPEPRGVVQ